MEKICLNTIKDTSWIMTEKIDIFDLIQISLDDKKNRLARVVVKVNDPESPIYIESTKILKQHLQGVFDTAVLQGCNTLLITYEETDSSVTIIIEDDGLYSDNRRKKYTQLIKDTVKGLGINIKIQRSRIGGCRISLTLKKWRGTLPMWY